MGVTPTQPADSKLVRNNIAKIVEGADPQARHDIRSFPSVKHTGKQVG
jgi:hypothetical protein